MPKRESTLVKLFELDNNSVDEFEVIKSIFTTSGPWIISIITLLSIKFFMKDIISTELLDLFLTIIIYSFIFSMILTAPFTNMINRYLGDKIYLKEYNSIFSVFISSFIVIAPISYLVAYFYISFFTELLEYKFIISQLFCSLSILWTMMIFTIIFKHYKIINFSFLLGMILSLCLINFYLNDDLYKLILGFNSGILFTISILVAKLKYDFTFNKLFDFTFLKDKKYYLFFLSGLFLYLALWIDKFIYWASDYGVEVEKGFFFFPEYDFIIFIAYLVIIPVNSYLTIYINDVFNKEQKLYFKAIEHKKSFAIINNYAKNLQNSFYRGIFKVTLFQFLISILFVFFVQYFFDKFNINVESIPILRIVVFAITLQMILMAIIMFLYYFDFQKEILFISFSYFVLNFCISYYMVNFSYDYIGYSYFISVLLTLLIAFLISSYKMERINFYMIAKNEV